ncbi:hypothetical protein F0562_013202 [Nyssa sinensis]|uniref:Uncharacterized protein n=1 Tax=Nyssa sinensis TaxID=561372 RepID=A0A5J4ZZA8_9ASTE|nr:hypothetical protein F0562_013202 [Nyssa sinensis]
MVVLLDNRVVVGPAWLALCGQHAVKEFQHMVLERILQVEQAILWSPRSWPNLERSADLARFQNPINFVV